ncbi:MAG: thioredoxin-disulfide reductase [Actinomycetota bacterium]
MRNLNKEIYDAMIIGGGPAGLTSGIYMARSMVKTLLIEKETLGGQALTTDLIENYPGFPKGISGLKLAQLMEEQTQDFGLDIALPCEAISIEKQNGLKKVITSSGDYLTKAIIIATGAHPARLNIPREKELQGKGVSYCATCDGPLFKDKIILVVGGGDAAVEEALLLSKFASKVIVVHRRDKLRATQILQDRAFKNPKIEFLWNSNVTEILGRTKVEGVIVRDKISGELRKIPVAGIFVYIGTVPNSDFVKNILHLDEKGYIITDEKLETSVAGIFAAGDVRKSPLKQVTTAVGEGALAAISAQKYLEQSSPESSNH